jgi:hypothetical protein
VDSALGQEPPPASQQVRFSQIAWVPAAGDLPDGQDGFRLRHRPWAGEPVREERVIIRFRQR